MANTITTKYGTKINVAGLTPEQVKRVKSIAEDNGAYGAKGAALANQLRKQAAKNSAPQTPTDPTTPAPTDPVAPPMPDLGLGEFNKKGAFEDPNQILSQAPKVPGMTDLAGDIGTVRDANYQYLSRDFATNKAQELETAKQELANRGIPFDPGPNSNSLYARTMKQIEQKYIDMDMQAKQQSIIGGDQSFSTQVGAAKTANDAFYQGVLGLTDAELTKYGIDKDTAVKLKQIQAAKEAARYQGGGAAPADNSPLIGGIAPG